MERPGSLNAADQADRPGMTCWLQPTKTASMALHCPAGGHNAGSANEIGMEPRCDPIPMPNPAQSTMSLG